MQQFGYCAVKQRQAGALLAADSFSSSTCAWTLRSQWAELYLDSETVFGRWPLAGHEHYCASALRVHLESPAFAVSLPPTSPPPTRPPPTRGTSSSTPPAPASPPACPPPTRGTSSSIPPVPASPPARPPPEPSQSPSLDERAGATHAQHATAHWWSWRWQWSLNERDTYAICIFAATAVGWIALLLCLLPSKRSLPPSGTPSAHLSVSPSLIATRNALIYGQ